MLQGHGAGAAPGQGGPNKSTKGASKLRRDLINTEIGYLRDLLPLPASTRQRLSQLQLMALVCVYVRKTNYFHQVFRRHGSYDDSGFPLHYQGLNQHGPHFPYHLYVHINFGFSKALSGFLMLITQQGKLLYISDNAAEYLGHSMEDLLIHGDSVYDMIDKQDHGSVQNELNKDIPLSNTSHHYHGYTHHYHHQHHGSHFGDGGAVGEQRRTFLCRMNVSRNARRQMRFGDQKVVLIQGRYVSHLALCSRNEPVFVALCTPVVMPETRECVVHGATNVFTTIHSMDMKYISIDSIGEFHTGFAKEELEGLSWYDLIHWEHLKEAQTKHRTLLQSGRERNCILLLGLQRQNGDWLWCHVVLQVKENTGTNNNTGENHQSLIVCTNQILSDTEAEVMQTNTWLYQYYSMQSKLQYSLAFDAQARLPAATTPHQMYYPHTPVTPPSSYHHHLSMEGSTASSPVNNGAVSPHYVSTIQYGGSTYHQLLLDNKSLDGGYIYPHIIQDGCGEGETGSGVVSMTARFLHVHPPKYVPMMNDSLDNTVRSKLWFTDTIQTVPDIDAKTIVSRCVSGGAGLSYSAESPDGSTVSNSSSNSLNSDCTVPRTPPNRAHTVITKYEV